MGQGGTPLNGGNAKEVNKTKAKPRVPSMYVKYQAESTCQPYETEWTHGASSVARMVAVQFLRSEPRTTQPK